MEKIEAWVTSDGKVWIDEHDAEVYEKRMKMIAYVEDISYRGMIEGGEQLVTFLDDYIERILEYYGVTQVT